MLGLLAERKRLDTTSRQARRAKRQDMLERVKPESVKKIPVSPNPEQLKKDLVLLKDKAYAAGATDVTQITSPDIVFLPGPLPGTTGPKLLASANWPVRYFQDSLRQALDAFSHGILFRVRAPMVYRDCGQGPIPNPAHRSLYAKSFEIASAVESAAFYMGHHLCLGFACGNCRAVFCHDRKRCQAMVKGRPCAHPYKARPSLYAVGIDAQAMANNSGWNVSPENSGSLITGLVMIA